MGLGMQPTPAQRVPDRTLQSVPLGALCVTLALLAAIAGYALAVVLLVLP
jgi:hypothetical protein